MSELVQLVLIAVGGIVALRSAQVRLDRDSIEAYKRRVEEMAATISELERREAQATRSRNDFADLWAEERDGRARDAITFRLELRRQGLELKAAEREATLVASSRRKSIRHARRRRGGS
jgi:hypothetical protein